VLPESSLTTNKSSRTRGKRSAKATDDPLTERAHKLTTLAFEKTPKPMLQGGFPAVLGIIKAALEAGYHDDDVQVAIMAGGVIWTKPAFVWAIDRVKRSNGKVSYEAPPVVYR
jgi:hypothetical protein